MNSLSSKKIEIVFCRCHESQRLSTTTFTRRCHHLLSRRTRRIPAQSFVSLAVESLHIRSTATMKTTKDFLNLTPVQVLNLMEEILHRRHQCRFSSSTSVALLAKMEKKLQRKPRPMLRIWSLEKSLRLLLPL